MVRALVEPRVREDGLEVALCLSGWEFRYPLAAATEEPYVEVSAQSADGESALLYAGYPKRQPTNRNEDAPRTWLQRFRCLARP